MLNKILTFVFAALIVAVIAAIIWLSIIPHNGNAFTEFYLLGADGKADNYPKDVHANIPVAVTVGIANREHTVVTYRVLLVNDNTTVGQTESINLADGQKWEEPVNFTLTKAGDNQTVEFFLYKNEQPDPYLSLNLRIGVK